MSSELRRTMDRQPEDLRRILADPGPAEAAAERLRDRRVFVIGTGTSWHACNHGGYFLRAAGVDARPVEAFDAAIGGPHPAAGDALLLLSHRNTKRYATIVRERAAALGVPTVADHRHRRRRRHRDGRRGRRPRRSPPATSAHWRALAQIAIALGADLGPLADVPDGGGGAPSPGPGRR